MHDHGSFWQADLYCFYSGVRHYDNAKKTDSNDNQENKTAVVNKPVLPQMVQETLRSLFIP